MDGCGHQGGGLAPAPRPPALPADPLAPSDEAEPLAAISRIAMAISATSSDAIICADVNGVIGHWNASAERMLGWTSAQAVGRRLDMIVPERLREAHRAGLARVAMGGAGKLVGGTVEVPALTADGREIPIELSLTMWSDTDGRPAGFGAIIRDLTAKKAAEEDRARDKAFVDAVLEHLPVMLFVKDASTLRYRMLNRAGEEAIGLPREGVIGHTDHDLTFAQADEYSERDRAVLASGIDDVSESAFERAPGDWRILRTRRVAMRDADGRAEYLIGITEDITERKQDQDRVTFLAHHDPLTGLVNRTRFAALLEDALPSSPAVLCIDLDRFKTVNDLFGHAIGDELLKRVAGTLTEIAGEDAVIGRLGGDEFTVIATGPQSAREAERLARAIVEAVAQPFVIEGRCARVGASVGIAVADVDGSDTTELLRNADLALYRAKNDGRGRFRFFEEAMDRAAHERRELEIDLRAALSTDAITVHFQPLTCLATGRVSGFEALARWNHETKGPISPEVFVPIAEETGLISEFGAYILRRAVREATTWAPPLRVAVNLSPAQFAHGDLAGEVEAILSEAGLDPSRLELEITEGLLLQDAERALEILNRLKSLGVRIAMDDFGTGYSSLSYFRQFPFDKVKIDQSFVREMCGNRQALAVVQAVIGLGRGLGMPVVAEGVETEQQLDALRAEGCTEVQGFFIGRPAPIEAFDSVVLDRTGFGADTATGSEKRLRA